MPGKGRAAAELGASELSLAVSVPLLSTDGTQDKISLKQWGGGRSIWPPSLYLLFDQCAHQDRYCEMCTPCVLNALFSFVFFSPNFAKQ